MHWFSRILEWLATGLGTVLGAIAGTMAALRSKDSPYPKIAGLSDRSKWLVDDEISPESAVRPIQAMLQWLQRQDGLTAEGQRELHAIEREGETDVALLREMVKPALWDFVAQNYHEWWSRYGIALAADPSEPLGDGAEIDTLWREYQVRSNAANQLPPQT